MIDIHSHILPGTDDGARDMYDTLEMLQMSADCGVTGIVATPHCNIPGMYDNYFDDWYVSLIHEVQDAVSENRIPVKVMPGMEVYATEQLPSLISDGKIMTINQSHYILMEFGFNEDPGFADFILKEVAALGVKPVIAHAERYYFIQDNPQLAYEWRKKGYVIQVNKGSLFGRFGEREEEIAHRLIRHNLVSVIASDGHSPFHRTTYMLDAREELSVDYSNQISDLFLSENPRRICADLPILMMDPIPFDDAEYHEFEF